MKKLFFVSAMLATSILSDGALSAQKPKGGNQSGQDLPALKAAAEKGDAQAQLEYGKALKDQSPADAGQWIQKAANQGLGEAWFWLGYAGLGKEKPLFYYEKAAEKGYPKAFQYLLEGLLFRAGTSADGSPADIVKAKKFGDLARKQNIKIGYNSAKMFETIDHCYEAGSPHVPADDQPSPEERKTFQESKIECLSYQTGVGAPQDWGKYRKCLLSQDAIDSNSLAEIYANGWGVKRNARLAIALICQASGVPAELEGMVDTLYSTKDQDRLQTEFSFCDHVTSGMNGGFCAARAEEIASKKRDGELAGITQKWTEAQKASFYSLKKAADEFFSEHANSEEDMSGTARVQIAIDEQAGLDAEFLNAIKSFEEGLLPKESDFIRADKELNEVYSKIMKKNKRNDFGTITKDGIKATQRKWLKYRDAWQKFAGLRYPNTSPDVWKTWLTKERIRQLKAFVQPSN